MLQISKQSLIYRLAYDHLPEYRQPQDFGLMGLCKMFWRAVRRGLMYLALLVTVGFLAYSLTLAVINPADWSAMSFSQSIGEAILMGIWGGIHGLGIVLLVVGGLFGLMMLCVAVLWVAERFLTNLLIWIYKHTLLQLIQSDTAQATWEMAKSAGKKLCPTVQIVP